MPPLRLQQKPNRKLHVQRQPGLTYNHQNPWATTEQDLQALFDCPYTGAVTTRTSLLHGFPHDDAVHQYAFFNPQDHSSTRNSSNPENDEKKNNEDTKVPTTSTASLNTLGYSPIPLATYLSIITKITTTAPQTQKTKPFIISITGTPSEIAQAHNLIATAQRRLPSSNPLCIEINLSCPNIPHKPPPAYSKSALLEYLDVLGSVQQQETACIGPRIAIGLKTPPYTHQAQFQTLIDALLEAASRCSIDFLTATNTLGSSLLLRKPGSSGDGNGGSGYDCDYPPALSSASGQGIGGLAGAPLHPLALGNVKILRGLLDAHEELTGVQVIGVGGVGDSEGYRRMRAVGAEVIGVGTALGSEGLGVFEKILGGVSVGGGGVRREGSKL